jgi:Ca-activated chloride channel homolog
MIRFAHPEYLIALGLLPMLMVLFWWSMRMRKRGLRLFGNPALLSQLMPQASGRKPLIKSACIVLAFGLVVLGLANPQIGTRMEEVHRQGVDVMICLDVSASMKCEDIKPNRLESAKQEITRLLDKLQNDRIGLAVFAGESYLQLPLTTDYSAARLILASVDENSVAVPGTAIGSAIRLAMKSFIAGEQKHKAIVLITDGENHEDDAIAAAKDANKEGVVVHAIGMGSPDGGPIPVYQNDAVTGFRKDADGTTVVTKLDEQALRQIAEAGGGTFVRATSRQDDLDAVFKQIQGMEKKELGGKIFTDYEDRFQIVLAAGLLLLVAEYFITERKNKWLAKLNIFGRRP